MHGPSLVYDDNTGYLILGGTDPLEDSEAPGVPITTATVTLESITTLDGVAVAGMSFPTAMPHVSGGKYRCKVPDTLNVTPGTVYEARVQVLAGSDVANLYLRFPAKKRVV
jgi:hypothetical protein